MKFTFKGDIRPPAPEYEITDWTFGAVDLSPMFDLDNNEIGDLLIERGVAVQPENEVDTESGGLWVYFKNEKSAKAFLRRLNRMPEIKNYEPPVIVKITPDDLLTAAEWLDVNEGEDGEKESCHKIADYLRSLVEEQDKKRIEDEIVAELVAKTGRPEDYCRKFWNDRKKKQELYGAIKARRNR